MFSAIWRITLLSAALSSVVQAGEPLSFCPGPDERYRSPLYEVRSAADGRVQVKLALSAEHPGYYFLRINGDYGDTHPLFIFADPPEKDVPAKGPGVHFFGPGVHDIGPHYAVQGGETVYLAPGAVVRGTLTARGANVRVCGRGILSGELLQEEWMRHKRGFVARPKDARGHGIAPMVWNDAWLGSTIVEGITIIDAPSYNLNLTGRYAVRNVKLLS